MSEEVAVLGAGNMGTAIAQVAATNGHHVRLWSIEHDVLEEVRDKRLNTRYLDDVRLHDNIEPVWEMAEAVQGTRLVVICVPSQVVRAVSHDLGPLVGEGQFVLNVGKGLEAVTHHRMSEVIASELADGCDPFVGSMGGPAVAIEMARGLPVAVIIGLPDHDATKVAQSILQNEHLKVQTTQDVAGLEVCSTLKNVYAIALGMCDGMRLGTNTKAFLSTVAIEEMRTIATRLGARPETVYGLAGLGDLITTGFSPHSRNRTLGDRLGAQGDWRGFIRTHTVEGVTAVRSMCELTEGVAGLPLLATLNQVLFHDDPAVAAMRRFLASFTYS
ncbi:MAG TPA: NAD(P)H-dependent glycerol-3-phosphate dehydrogenase [Dehalococcoidia bacterium]|nr:NAD(P)H-dependent glycerol-3-phosphate dehydrogenase [Dehalococcoidia bacterium]